MTCEHGGRRVSRTEHDGRIVSLASEYRGQRLNSPNDVVVRSDGSVWFTDPTYGIDSDYEGHRAESEIGASHVWRIAPSGALTIAADDFVKPNGLAFSPDETQLYVVDTGRSHGPEHPAHMRVFDVDAAGALSGGRVFADCTAGFFDGFRFDGAGRIWTSAGDGVHCYDPDGTLLGKVRVPEIVSNVCFGGPKRNRLYICGTTSLYAVFLLRQRRRDVLAVTRTPFRKPSQESLIRVSTNRIDVQRTIWKGEHNSIAPTTGCHPWRRSDWIGRRHDGCSRNGCRHPGIADNSWTRSAAPPAWRSSPSSRAEDGRWVTWSVRDTGNARAATRRRLPLRRHALHRPRLGGADRRA